MKRRIFVIGIILAAILGLSSIGFAMWGIIQQDIIDGSFRSYSIIDLDDAAESSINAISYSSSGFSGNSQYSTSFSVILDLKQKSEPYDVVVVLDDEDGFIPSNNLSITCQGNTIYNSKSITISGINNNCMVTITYTIITDSLGWPSLYTAFESNKMILLKASAISSNGLWNTTKIININANKSSFSITYVLNGGTNNSSNITEYDLETNFVLLNATKQYYTFSGWYTSSTFENGTQIGIINGQTEDLILYAKFTPLTFNIYYYDGSERIYNITPSTYTIEDELLLPTYEKENYTFNGWYLNSELSGTAVSTILQGTTGSKTFYAKTVDLGYDVNFYDTDKTTLLSTAHASTNGAIVAPSYSSYDPANYVLKWCDKSTNLEVDLTNIDKAYNLYAKLVDKRYHVLVYYTDKDNFLNNYYDMEGNIYSDLGMKNIGDTIALTKQMRIYESNGTDSKDIFYMSPVTSFNWTWMDCLVDSATSTYGCPNVLCKVETVDDVKFLYIVVLCVQPVAIMTSSSQTIAYSTDTNMSTSTYTFYMDMDSAFGGLNNQPNKLLRLYGRMKGVTTDNCLTTDETIGAHNITISINDNDVIFKVPAFTYSISDFTLTRSTTTIASNSKLLLPYVRSCIDTDGFIRQQTSEASKIVQSILTIDENKTIINNGEICVGGYIYGSNGIVCQHGVIINNGTINNNNVVIAYGFIKGNGLIDCAATSQLNDVFYINDWPGGADAMGMYDTNIFPFNCYSIHNVSCRTKIAYNATYKAWTQIYMGNQWTTHSDMVILGDGGLFSLTSGYVVKWAECTTDSKYYLTNENRTISQKYLDLNQHITQRDVLEIYGDFHDNSISVHVEIKILFTIARDITTSTSLALPIGFMRIIFKEGIGNLSVNSYKFLPGSSIIVEKNADLTIASGVQMIIYENYSDKDVSYTNSKGVTGPYNNGYWNKHSAIYSNNNVIDNYYSKFIVDGKLTINGNVGGKIYTNLPGSYINTTKVSATLPKLATLNYGQTGSSATTTNDTKNLELMLYNESTEKIDNFSAVNSTGIYIGVSGVNASNEEVNGFAKSNNVNNFTITYVTNFTENISPSSVNTINSNYVIKSSDLTEVSRIGYIFDGWYMDNTFNTPAIGHTISSNITVYAKWIIKTYYIEYHYDYLEGCNTTGSIIINNPSVFNANSNITFAPDVDGSLAFNGWFIDQDLTTNAPAINSSTFEYYTMIIDSNDTLHLYCQFSNIQLFNYSYLDKNNSIINSGQVAEGNSIILDAPSDVEYDIAPNGSYSKTHYTFDKWDIRDTNGAHITYKNVGESYTLSENIIIKPIYNTLNYYKITFNKNSTPGGNAGSITIFYKNPGDNSYSSFTQNFGSNDLSKNNIEIVSGGSIYYTKGSNVNSITYDGNSWSDGSGNAKTVNANATIVVQSTTSSGACVAKGTLITLADGTQKKVEDLTMDDHLLSFNHITGVYESTPLFMVVNHGKHVYDVIRLIFDDDTELKIIESHGLFDFVAQKYVHIDQSNYLDYIGHEFAKYNNETGLTEKVTLISADIIQEETEMMAPFAYGTLNAITNGLVSYDTKLFGTYNYFEYDNDMKYDAIRMQEDIETYGLFTYDDWKEYISLEIFDAFHFDFFKVSIAKGLMSEEDLIGYIYWLTELIETGCIPISKYLIH